MQKIEKILKELLDSLGIDLQVSSLEETPERVAKMLFELTHGHRNPPPPIEGELIDFEGKDLIVVKRIPFYSLCEHHLLPFFGEINIGYFPSGKILGISAFNKVVSYFSKKLQIQERMTREIGVYLESVLRPDGIAVVAEGTHLCAIMRGEGSPDFRLVTSFYSGKFEDPLVRREFVSRID